MQRVGSDVPHSVFWLYATRPEGQASQPLWSDIGCAPEFGPSPIEIRQRPESAPTRKVSVAYNIDHHSRFTTPAWTWPGILNPE